MLAPRINNVTLSGTMAVASKTIEMQSNGINVLNLCVGEPDLPTPENIKEAAKRAIDVNKTKYTLNTGIVELRKAICEKFKTEYHSDYDINEVIVSNGAKQSVYNALQTIVTDGDEVLIPLPYYVSYPEMVKLADGVPKFVETQLRNSYKMTPKEFEASITNKTRVLILCNPNNPTGVVYTKDELMSLVKIAKKNNLIVISDEIYEKLIYMPAKFTSLTEFGAEYKDSLIIINGVSKAYSMTGWRIGYAVSNKEICIGMSKLQSHSTSGAGSISQYASLEALTGSQESVEKQRLIFEERRDVLIEKLGKIESLNFVYPEGAFYLFVGIQEILEKSKLINTSQDFCMKLLDEAHVATVPGTVFGMEGYIRLSYSKSKEELENAVERIKNAVDSFI